VLRFFIVIAKLLVLRRAHGEAPGRGHDDGRAAMLAFAELLAGSERAFSLGCEDLLPYHHPPVVLFFQDILLPPTDTGGDQRQR
jgi:hypothetical protein